MVKIRCVSVSVSSAASSSTICARSRSSSVAGWKVISRFFAPSWMPSAASERGRSSSVDPPHAVDAQPPDQEHSLRILTELDDASGDIPRRRRNASAPSWLSNGAIASSNAPSRCLATVHVRHRNARNQRRGDGSERSRTGRPAPATGRGCSCCKRLAEAYQPQTHRLGDAAGPSELSSISDLAVDAKTVGLDLAVSQAKFAVTDACRSPPAAAAGPAAARMSSITQRSSP